MSLQPVKALCTVEDYLALERASEERHEYLDGQLYAMAGESPEHGTICTNLTMLIMVTGNYPPPAVWPAVCLLSRLPVPCVWQTSMSAGRFHRRYSKHIPRSHHWPKKPLSDSRVRPLTRYCCRE